MSLLDKLLADAIVGGANSAKSDAKIRELDSKNLEQRLENERLERENKASEAERERLEALNNQSQSAAQINLIYATKWRKLLNQPPAVIASQHKGFAEHWESQQRCLASTTALLSAFQDLALEYGAKLNIENKLTMARGYDDAVALADNYNSDPQLKDFAQGGEYVFKDRRIESIKYQIKRWKSQI